MFSETPVRVGVFAVVGVSAFAHVGMFWCFLAFFYGRDASSGGKRGVPALVAHKHVGAPPPAID